MADGIDGIFVDKGLFQKFQADDWLQTANCAPSLISVAMLRPGTGAAAAGV